MEYDQGREALTFVRRTPVHDVLGTTADGVSLRIKVVPGASRTGMVGLLGDRVKIAVSAPPTGGRANRAVCDLLSTAFGVPRRNVVVARGHGRPQKTIDLVGLSLCRATEVLKGMLGE